MASFSSSSSSAKSQPLHNFELPAELKWNKEGEPSGTHKGRRSMKSPPPRANAAPLRHSPLRGSVTSPPPRFPSAAAPPRFQQQALRDSSPLPSRFQSPRRDFAPPPHRLHRYFFREPPPPRDSRVIGDDLVKNSPFSEEKKQSLAIDDEFERRRPSLLREESPKHYLRRDWSSESSDREKGKAPIIAYSRNPVKKTGFSPPLMIRSSIDEGTKLAKKPKSAEADAGGEVDAHMRNPFKKPAFASSPKDGKESRAGGEDDVILKNKFKKTQFVSSSFSDSEERSKEPEDDVSPINSKRSAFNSFSSIPEKVKLEKKSKAAEMDAAAIKKPNLIIKIGGKDENPENDDVAGEMTKEVVKSDEKWDEEIKVWNLRPRNVKRKPERANAGQPPQPTGDKKEKGEKPEKKKLSIEISLTKHEIEQDLFALTGAKPSRRPKKWPKNVQKQLDSVFPGLNLVSITPESYKVSENSLRG